MYILDSVKKQTADNTSIKTFPNLSAIEQMNRYIKNTEKICTKQSDKKIDIEVLMLMLVTFMLEKENTNMDISILPIILMLLH